MSRTRASDLAGISVHYSFPLSMVHINASVSGSMFNCFEATAKQMNIQTFDLEKCRRRLRFGC